MHRLWQTLKETENRAQSSRTNDARGITIPLTSTIPIHVNIDFTIGRWCCSTRSHIQAVASLPISIGMSHMSLVFPFIFIQILFSIRNVAYSITTRHGRRNDQQALYYNNYSPCDYSGRMINCRGPTVDRTIPHIRVGRACGGVNNSLRRIERAKKTESEGKNGIESAL